jgi:uncharacterized protein (DUF1800 family)
MSIAEPADRAIGTPGEEGSGEEKPAPRRAVSRRTVLGAAVAGGAGVAAVRLWGADAMNRFVPGARTASGGRSDWISPLGSERARVIQLLRRATFGATPQQLEQALSDGFGKTVDRLVETKPVAPPPFGTDAAQYARLNIGQLQQWWVDHILTTATPFAERMTLYWHGHFTSDYRKVGVQTPYIYWQNLTWREAGLTDFRSMLMKVTSDPAMLRYLDLSTSTGASPNENYSRELMELFTMGTGHYSEDDVRAAAKALAGWVEPKPTGTTNVVIDPKNNITRKLPVYDTPVPGTVDPRRAFKGQVTFLGKTGTFDTQAVLDRILQQPATAPFLVKRILQHFAINQPSTDYVNRLAGTFKASNWDVKSLMKAVFTSPEFVSDAAYRSLVKTPAEFMIGAIRAIGNPPAASRLVVQNSANMGQVLFDPPDVGGWPNNEAWISSNTVIARVNFVTALLNAAKSIPPAGQAHADHLDGVLSPQTAAALNAATDDRTRWFVVLASPEFQLK